MLARTSSKLIRLGGLAGLAAAVLSIAWPSAAFGRIDSDLAYQRDGCQRTSVGLLDPRQAQSWVYVNRSRDPVEAEGPIEKVKVSDEDLYAQHEDNQRWDPDYFMQHDVNIDVAVTNEDLLATGDPDNLLHVEAHSGEWAYLNEVTRWYDPFNRSRLGGDYFPARSWGMPGDWAVGRGPLIWDCGHWDDGGEDTELHTFRWWQASHWLPVGYVFNPAEPRRVGIAAQHEIYGNSNRQSSGLVQEWRKTCDEGSCNDNNRQDPLVRNGVESFFLAAPPKPSGTAQLRWKENRYAVTKMNNVGQVTVDPAGDSGVNVTVDMRGQSGPERDNGYAATWYVGWDQSQPGVGFTKIKTEFTRYQCLHDLDLLSRGEFQLQFGVANNWWYRWDAGLNNCDQPAWVTLNPRPTLKAIVPDDQRLPIRLRGYENDDLLPGQAIADIDRLAPLKSGTRIVDDPSSNNDYRLEVKTTVLDHYDPVP